MKRNIILTTAIICLIFFTSCKTTSEALGTLDIKPDAETLGIESGNVFCCKHSSSGCRYNIVISEKREDDTFLVNIKEKECDFTVDFPKSNSDFYIIKRSYLSDYGCKKLSNTRGRL